MTTLVGALILLLLGMLGGRFAIPSGEYGTGRLLLVTARWHFLLVGFLLGPHALGLLRPETLGQLYPVLLLGTGWVGLLFGAQFSWHRLRRIRPRHIALLILQAILAFLVFAAAGLFFMERLGHANDDVRVIVLAAAATACVSGPLAVAVIKATVPGGRLTEFILLAGSLDGVVGLLALQIVGAVFHPREPVARLEPLGPVGWILVAVALGLAFGLLFVFLTRRMPSKDETVLYLLGLVLFLAAAATSMGVFAVFVAFVTGALLANRSRHRRRIYARLQEWVRPVYVVLLVLMGSLLYFPGWWILGLGCGYAALRVLAKITGAWIGRLLSGTSRDLPPMLGAGLVAHGGMSLVLALSAAIGYGGLDPTTSSPANILLGTVAIGVLLADLCAPALARLLLGRAGELPPARRNGARRSNDVDAPAPDARAASAP